jgi:transcriptional regulator with XRE-family HTH domain
MKNKQFRESIHSSKNIALRHYWINQRKELGLSQRDVAKKLEVTRSLVGKIETGDRRLDILEMIVYCKVLSIDPHKIINFLEEEFGK